MTDPAFNRAIITSEFDDPDAVCHRCGEAVDAEELSVEAFEDFGAITCVACAEALWEERAGELNSSGHDAPRNARRVYFGAPAWLFSTSPHRITGRPETHDADPVFRLHG